MEFRLSDKVRLRGEKRQWVLERLAQRRRGDKTVTEYKPLGYYPSAAAAIRSAAEYDQRMAKDWGDLQGRWNRLMDAMETELLVPIDAIEESALALQAWWADREINDGKH